MCDVMFRGRWRTNAFWATSPRYDLDFYQSQFLVGVEKFSKSENVENTTKSKRAEHCDGVRKRLRSAAVDGCAKMRQSAKIREPCERRPQIRDPCDGARRNTRGVRGAPRSGRIFEKCQYSPNYASAGGCAT